jgi:hypothetical protein
MTAMTPRVARHHLFAVLGLACAALALACLAVICLPPPAFETTITMATPESGYAWVASLPKTFPRMLRPLYRISKGDIDGDRSTKLTENGRPLGPGGALHDDIRQMGQGRYSHWGNSLYFAASDNSNPNTNGRRYILRTTTSARGYIYGITAIAAGLALLFFYLCKGKSAFTELWLIGKGLPAELWRSAKKWRLALQEKQNLYWIAYTKRFFRPPGLKLYARRFCEIWRKSGPARRLSLCVSLALFLASCVSLACLAFITSKHRIFIYFAGAGFAGLASLLYFLWIKKLTFSEFFRETITVLQRRKRAWHEALQRDRANFAFETFVWTHFLYGLGMFLLAFVLLSTLWPPFFEATFESDTEIPRLRILRDIFSGKTAIGDIRPPADHVYFDGLYIIYAFASFVMKYGAALLSRLHFSSIAVDNVDELIIFTMYFVNTGLLALACAFLFHFVLKVTKSIVPAMLFALVFICSYQTITAFNLIRSDAYITSCLLILICFSVSFALGRLRKHSYLVAGIFSALLVCTKVTAFLFLLIPLLAFFIQRKNAVFRNEAYKYALVLCIGTLLLQFRYILNPGHILSNASSILTQMRVWNALMSKTPLFYYNVDIYQSEPFFLALTLLGVVINIFGIRKNKPSSILLASFFFFSLLGLPAPKLARWGYHIFLLALFLLITAHLYIVEKVRLTRWRRLYSLSVLLLAAGLLFDGGKNFITTKRDLANRYNRELRVQIAAASWLRNNIPAKEKICILTSSEWQMPPGDFNYVNEGFFIDYNKPGFVANYRLPEVSELPASCPIFILGSFHHYFYGFILASHNPHVDWNGYFAMLEKRFPPVVFESADKKNWLKIFRINSHDTR